MSGATAFFARTRIMPSGCVEWIGRINWAGYGVMHLPGGRRSTTAHRYAYVLVHGPVEHDLQIDHLCRNRRCVAPRHLEAVSARVNTLRSHAISAVNAAKTACKHGHPFDLFNTYVYPPGSTSAGERVCRSCQRVRQAAYLARRAR